MEKFLIKEKQLPGKNKTIVYFVVIVFSFIFLYFLNFVLNSPVGSMSWNIFINIGILIVGWNDIWRYSGRVDRNFKLTFIIGVRTLAYQSLVAIIFLLILSFININDPQGIKDLTYSFKEFFYLFSLDLILTAVGEEFWKLLMILTISKLIYNFKIPIHFKVIIIITIPSIVFGLAHNINYQNTAWIPIAAMTIPSFIIFLKYKSILPLVIAHFIFDFISMVSKIDNMGSIIINILGVILIAVYLFFEKALDRNLK